MILLLGIVKELKGYKLNRNAFLNTINQVENIKLRNEIIDILRRNKMIK